METNYFKQFQETIYSETMSNGLRVYVIPKQEMTKTYAIFSTKYGSIDRSFVPIDQDSLITVPDGIALFLEHKLFEKEDRDVFQDFSKQGASSNAFTSFTKTAYLFSSTSNVEQNLTTLIDFVQDPYFSDESVEKEKGIIAQEIKMYDDQPDWRAFFGTIKSMFAHHPVQIDIAGTVESINQITKEDLYTCYHTFYHPSNMVLCVVGNVEPEAILDQVRLNQEQKEFKPMDQVKRSFPEEPVEVAQKELVIDMPVSIPKALVGIKERNIPLDKDDFAKREWMIDITLDYLFSKSGKAYERLYEEGLIDQSFSSETSLEENFGFSIVGGNSQQPEVLADKIKEELLQFSKSPMDKSGFERIKRKKFGQLLRAMNSLEFIANQYSHYQLMNMDFFETAELLEQLSYEEFLAFAHDWIDEKQLSVCFVK